MIEETGLSSSLNSPARRHLYQHSLVKEPEKPSETATRNSLDTYSGVVALFPVSESQMGD